MPRPSGLRVEPRINQSIGKTDGFTIVGSVAGVRIRRRAQSNDGKLARKEAAVLEVAILNTAWHGERRAARAFAEAALSYLDAAPRSPRIKAQIGRLLRALGDVKLGQVNQQTATELKRRMLQPEVTAATYVREIIMPLRAILNHAHKLDWCEVPHFTIPRTPQGRTLYLLPDEIDRLIAAAAPHLQPLLLFLVGTGARMSEALELDWADVDLVGARAIFWRTKSGKRRNAHLPPTVVAALADLAHRDGRVFRWATQTRKDGTARRLADYADRERRYGGQIKTAWAGAIRRAGVNPELTPHDLRHTWASWHYALNRDLLALRIEGGWSSVSLCERYAHLLPAGQETAIRRFFGHLSGIGAEAAAASG